MCKQKIAWRLQIVSFTAIVTCLSDCSYYECSLLFKFDFSSPAEQGRLVGYALVPSGEALSRCLRHSGKKVIWQPVGPIQCGVENHLCDIPGGACIYHACWAETNCKLFFLKVPNRLYCHASVAGENEMGTEERWVSSVPQVLTKPHRWCGHLDYSARFPRSWRRKRRTSRHVITVVMWKLRGNR